MRHITFSPRPIRRAIAGVAPARCRWALAALLVMWTSGCARSSNTRAIPPHLTPTPHAQGVRPTMTPLARVPVTLTSTAGARMVRIGPHSYGPGLPPERWPLIVIDGVALGLRSDGTVDHLAAQRLFQLVDCARIVSTHSLMRDEAVERFGRAAHRGALLITTGPNASRVHSGRP